MSVTPLSASAYTPSQSGEPPRATPAEAAEAKAVARTARDEAVKLQRFAKLAQGAAHDAVQAARFSLAALGFRRQQLGQAAEGGEAELARLADENARRLLEIEPLLHRAREAREGAVRASERFLELARAANRTSHEAGLALPFQVAKNVRDLFDIKALASRGQAFAREVAELARRLTTPADVLGPLAARLDALAEQEAAAAKGTAGEDAPASAA